MLGGGVAEVVAAVHAGHAVVIERKRRQHGGRVAGTGVGGKASLRRRVVIYVLLLDGLRCGPGRDAAVWLFVDLDDDAELDAALGSNEPLSCVFENRLVGLGESDFKHDTGAAAGGDRGGSTVGAPVEVSEGGVRLFVDADDVFSAPGDDRRGRIGQDGDGGAGKECDGAAFRMRCGVR